MVRICQQEDINGSQGQIRRIWALIPPTSQILGSRRTRAWVDLLVSDRRPVFPDQKSEQNFPPWVLIPQANTKFTHMLHHLPLGWLWVQYCVSVRECMATTRRIGRAGGQ